MSDCSRNAFKVPEKPELKPCPLCGSKAIIHADQLAVDPDPMYYTILCPSCKLNLKRAGYMADKELIEAWNTRYQPTCEEIIRCRDCEFFDEKGIYRDWWCNRLGLTPSKDSFCYWAEKVD